MAEITIVILAIIAFVNNRNVRILSARIERQEKKIADLERRVQIQQLKKAIIRESSRDGIPY